ncbi:MAG TPA: hypothetical protein VGB55_08305 [Tepidisphaeraceae bacterium]|jgi:hypothetical protein
MQGLKIGEILIEQGILSDAQVRNILSIQKTAGRPFGDLAERLYGIDPQAVEDAWVEQYVRTAGTVDLEEVEIDRGVRAMVNRRQAWQFHMLPLYRDAGHLAIATTADALVRAVNFGTRRFHEPVTFFIVDKEQLHDHLMKHYPVPQFIAEFAESF